MSSESYRNTYNELVERLERATTMPEDTAKYFKGIKVTMYCRCNLEISWINEWDKIKRKEFNLYILPCISITIPASSEEKDYESFTLKEAVKRIFRYTLKTLYTKLLQFLEYSRVYAIVKSDLKVSVGTDKYDEISIEIDNNNLIAWDYSHVYIWHEEQECGEGWIIASRDPEYIQEQTTIVIK